MRAPVFSLASTWSAERKSRGSKAYTTVRFPTDAAQELKIEAAKRGLTREAALVQAYRAWKAAGDDLPVAQYTSEVLDGLGRDSELVKPPKKLFESRNSWLT